MKSFKVVVHFKGRKQYLVEAESHDEAINNVKDKFMGEKRNDLKGAIVNSYTSIYVDEVESNEF